MEKYLVRIEFRYSDAPETEVGVYDTFEEACQNGNNMSKLPSFKYKKMIFHNVKDNLFQTEKFGDKLIYKFENGKYHLVKDERLSSVIGIDEVSGNPNSICNNDYWWK